MARKLEVYNDIITIKMDVNQLPTYKIDSAGEFIKWGKDNNFPKELLNYPTLKGMLCKNM